ncbi:MAG: dihydroorotate dehydrogenase [Defluviitaleaceae bacterium]|nr:dihydroorotate dehydrogenase [Defluviitaleaceae bacterium]
MSVICGINWKTPVTTASGTFSRESAALVDVKRLGAVTLKGVSCEPWHGNPPPRIAETYGGMLNSVGLQNIGADEFIKNELPFWLRFGTPVIVNLAGHTVDEYVNAAKKFNDTPVEMFELNISCPNVDMGGMAFGTDAKTAGHVVSEVKKVSAKPLIVKLSPNVTDITEIARAAEASGADAISMINTILGMKIDITKRKPLLANTFGGLSGPAVKPVAVRMVYQVSGAVKIPVIGMGGIINAADAVEFFMAGASAVAIGTASFADPHAVIKIIDGIGEFLVKNNINDIEEIIGCSRIK